MQANTACPYSGQLRGINSSDHFYCMEINQHTFYYIYYNHIILKFLISFSIFHCLPQEYDIPLFGMNLLPNSSTCTSVWLCRSCKRPRQWPLLADQNLVVRERQFLPTIRNVAHTMTLLHLKHSPTQSSSQLYPAQPIALRAPAISLLCPYHYGCYIHTSEDSGQLACDAVSLTVQFPRSE